MSDSLRKQAVRGVLLSYGVPFCDMDAISDEIEAIFQEHPVVGGGTEPDKTGK